MKNDRMIAGMFLLAALASFAGAFVPMIKGRDMNAAFLGVGVMWLIFAIAKMRRRES